MKKLCMMLSILVLASSISTAQVKAIHFKKLQEFLPAKELKGFKRLKPSGTTQTNMGLSTSEAEVRYESISKDTIQSIEGGMNEPVMSIEAKISDMVAIPYATMGYQMQQEYENETENSSEKSIMIKNKYKGKEEIHKGESKSCKIEFAVANRYLFNFEASGTDSIKVLYNLVESINYDNLEKLTTEAK
jgi:hypothetical protein